MNKTFLIFKHEFLNLVRKKGFIILTFIFPLIGLLAISIFLGSQATGDTGGTEVTRIGYVDQTGRFDEPAGDATGIALVPYDTPGEANAALISADINEYFVIPTDYIQYGAVVRYHTQKELEPPARIYQAMRVFLLDNLLAEQTSPELAERIKSPLGVSSIRLDEAGEVAADQGGFATLIIPMIFGFLLVMAIGSSAGYLIQGLGEEKENRIMEILLSSVSTRQLLIGKVLGLGSAGLVQIIVWLLSAFLLVRLASTTIGGFFSSIQLSGSIFALGIVYFILGYLLFAVIQAGIGAIAVNPKETQQTSALMMLTAISPFYVAIFFLQEHPDHIIGTIMTIFPITAPMTVFVRLGISDIAVWELAVSIGVLVLSIVGSLLLAAKIFRVFLLMHGKTPRLGDIFRLLKQA